MVQNTDGVASPDGDVFVELAKINADSSEKRRIAEWKVAFGFWLGIAAFTWFITQRDLGNVAQAKWLLGVAFLAAFAVWVLGWQFPLHRAHLEDQVWRHYYKDRAEGLSREQPASVSYWTPASKPWIWGQVAMTALFLVLAYGLIFGTSSTDPQLGPSTDRLSGENLRIVLEKLPSAT